MFRKQCTILWLETLNFQPSNSVPFDVKNSDQNEHTEIFGIDTNQAEQVSNPN